MSTLSLFHYIFAPPPPPPPLLPPTTMDGFLASLFSAVLFATTICVMLSSLISFARAAWRRNFERIALVAFRKTDIDHSGTIDRQEMYLAVLETYLLLHRRGLNVRPPARKAVYALMSSYDGRRRSTVSGEIGFEQFKLLLETLLRGLVGRIFAQIGLTMLCPVTASYVCHFARQVAGSQAVGGSVAAFGSLLWPSALAALYARWPGGLDHALVCSVLMIAVGPCLSLVDSRLVARAELQQKTRAQQQERDMRTSWGRGGTGSFYSASKDGAVRVSYSPEAVARHREPLGSVESAE